MFNSKNYISDTTHWCDDRLRCKGSEVFLWGLNKRQARLRAKVGVGDRW